MTRDRYFYIFVFFICAILSGVAFYYNYVEKVPICPLCSMQLICYYVIGIVSLVAFFQDPDKAGHIFYAILLLFFTVLGIVFASRQLWMQHLPASQVLSCGPSLPFMMANFPLSSVIETIFNRADACSMVQWTFIGFSMAAWSLFFYVVIGISTVLSLAFYSKAAQQEHFKLQHI